MFLTAKYRVSRTFLFFLLYPYNIFVVFESLDHCFLIIPHDDISLLNARPSASVQHISKHRPTAHFMQHLRQLGIHPAAHARGQYYRNSLIQFRTVPLTFKLFYFIRD